MEEAMQRRGTTSITIGAVATIAALAGITGCTTSAQTTPGAAVPPTVAVVAAQERDLPLEASYTGRVEAIAPSNFVRGCPALLSRSCFVRDHCIERSATK